MPRRRRSTMSSGAFDHDQLPPGAAAAGATAGVRSLTDRFAVDAHLRQREVDEFLAAIGI
jgi:hypothetical protein